MKVLDAPASRHFTFRQLVECGETFYRRAVPTAEAPQQAASWEMLAGLALHILDPVVDELGPVQLTYCFAPASLTREIQRRKRTEKIHALIDPRVDQHAACELKENGEPICERPGAAVDFRVPGKSMVEVVRWLVESMPKLPIDKLYYYGEERPVHVSWSPSPEGRRNAHRDLRVQARALHWAKAEQGAAARAARWAGSKEMSVTPGLR